MSVTVGPPHVAEVRTEWDGESYSSVCCCVLFPKAPSLGQHTEQPPEVTLDHLTLLSQKNISFLLVFLFYLYFKTHQKTLDPPFININVYAWNQPCSTRPSSCPRRVGCSMVMLSMAVQSPESLGRGEQEMPNT